MAEDLIRYDLLVQDALKGVVRKVLTDAARDGLAGDHHFYVSFSDRASRRAHVPTPARQVPAGNDDRAPAPVLGSRRHRACLRGRACRFRASRSACSSRSTRSPGFFDPSVQFGLKFEIRSEVPEGSEAAPAAKSGQPARGAAVGARRVAAETGRGPGAQEPCAQTRGEAEARGWPRRQGDAELSAAEKSEKPDDAGAPAAEVVSLDAFRKKS